jgi:uncharacterized protein YkuJ
VKHRRHNCRLKNHFALMMVECIVVAPTMNDSRSVVAVVVAMIASDERKQFELDGVVVVALNYSSMEQSMMKAAVKRAPDYVDDERLTSQLLAPVQDNAMSS